MTTAPNPAEGLVTQWKNNHDHQIALKKVVEANYKVARAALLEIKELAAGGGPLCSDPWREVATIAARALEWSAGVDYGQIYSSADPGGIHG